MQDEIVFRGHSQMTSAERGREGGYPNSDAVREVVWFYYYRLAQNADKGGEGVKNLKILADVICERPLS